MIMFYYFLKLPIPEMADITFCRSLGILMDALMTSLQEILSSAMSNRLHLLLILKQDYRNI